MSIEKIESYLIEEKLYVNTKFLQAYFKKSDKQIGRWKKDNMPVAKKPQVLKIRGDVYALDEVVVWVNQNINQSKSRIGSKKVGADEDTEPGDIAKDLKSIEEKIKTANELLDVEKTPELQAERIKKVLDALEKALKVGESSRGLLPAKDIKNTLIEMTATLARSLKKIKKDLPKDLHGMDEKRVGEEYERVFKNELENIKKIIKGKLNAEEIEKATNIKLIKVLDKVYDLMDDGVEINEIIERLTHE